MRQEKKTEDANLEESRLPEPGCSKIFMFVSFSGECRTLFT